MNKYSETRAKYYKAHYTDWPTAQSRIESARQHLTVDRVMPVRGSRGVTVLMDGKYYACFVDLTCAHQAVKLWQEFWVIGRSARWEVVP